MSLLFNVVFSTACSSTHHKLAMDALRQLRGRDASLRHDLFLKHYESYLEGSKAPDTKFKDFKNHVLHVDENYWGGAVAAARLWYERAVAALRQRNWADAAYSAGVLSHYYSDPLMPFHTGQSEAEGAVHRAAEWSIACAYGEVRDLIESRLGGYPSVEIPAGDDWLGEMVERGAEFSHPHYDVLIDHYDLSRGVKDPPAGLDSECRERIARCLAHATVGIARILERAFEEAGVVPPEVELSLEAFLATLKIPIRWVTKKMADADERELVERIYAEVQQKGKAVASLPEDDKLIRKLHAEEVMQTPLRELDAQKPRRTGQQHGKRHVEQAPQSSVPDAASIGAAVLRREASLPAPATAMPKQTRLPSVSAESTSTSQQSPRTKPRSDAEPSVPGSFPAQAVGSLPVAADQGTPHDPPSERSNEPPLRFYLESESDLVDAPSIGPRTAERFRVLGVRTVSDLLKLDPAAAAPKLGARWLNATVLRDMQSQAELVCRIPGLRGHDAQILVACDVTDPAALARMQPASLLARIVPFLETPAGERILRSSEKPDLDEVRHWIAAARQARALKAA